MCELYVETLSRNKYLSDSCVGCSCKYYTYAGRLDHKNKRQLKNLSVKLTMNTKKQFNMQFKNEDFFITKITFYLPPTRFNLEHLTLLSLHTFGVSVVLDQFNHLLIGAMLFLASGKFRITANHISEQTFLIILKILMKQTSTY